ncbi:RNA polymerase sigma factor [Roseivirga sp. UBA1976]|uniref:RNA polymerase sigma factor n=1 Tax=Roseivirga sp. UBA1976 TaxID=1947386 RepID=UPI00257990C0|nr:RNA polymerase sigma factor [Roseivirga sp. UBA1976]MEC7754928.1 RNA polymerase sigma factor [Bacteroidota bacterium]|tara:strand:+ start:5242 stop:5781 length:540 start_codon:yes stop_codon:yes gene_type:complete
MLKVKAGQLDQLGLLFERYNRPLYGFFYRLTSDGNASEDLVQNVFVRIIKYRHTYKGDGKFSTWIFHMARNLFADYYKKEKRLGYREDVSVTDKYYADNNNAETFKIASEERHLLEKAMRRLSAEKREILVLSKYQGMKYSDIAELLDCSESAVKVRIFRALKELKANYEKLECEVVKP